MTSIVETQNFIILKKTKYSESDLIITAISTVGEKKSFIAKSALKSKKRFGGGILEPTHHVKLTYQNKEQKNQLNILEEAQLLNDFKELRQNYDLLELALKIIDCVLRVTQEGDVNSSHLYNLLGHTLKNLSKIGETEHSKKKSVSSQNQEEMNLFLCSISVVKLQFFLKFFSEQGVLELQEWMTPYLRYKMDEYLNLTNQINKDSSHLVFIENQVSTYLNNGHFF